MNTNRRTFLRNAALATAGSSLIMKGCREGSRNPDPENRNPDSPPGRAGHEVNVPGRLEEILSSPILDTSLIPKPVIIDTIELLRYKDNFICRVRSTDGAEGLSVSNNMHMVTLYPIFLHRIRPVFLGKDAVQLEQLIEEAYVYHSNYKLQSLAIWVPLATLEFAILDMLGRIAGRSMGELIGTIHQREIAVYQANNFRGLKAEASVEKMLKQVEQTGAEAIKFKVGGRMSREEIPEGRTEALIPLVREAFGPEMTIYADANGSYDADEAIRIGRLMEEHNIDFFEEPVPFDAYEETRRVTTALDIPVAGGEQEASMRNFHWLIREDALDIVQPDIFYFGGMIRSMKVALMAYAKGKPCVPHISGSGLGYLYMMHFVSAIPNAGPYHEFKGFNNEIPFTCETSDVTARKGKIAVPAGPGSGITIDPDFIGKHQPVEA